jgi:hypothetical protein
MTFGLATRHNPVKSVEKHEIEMIWSLSHRGDVGALPLADRHYNRQKPGSPQFVPPGRCLVLRAPQALWVTSWPFAQYVKHAWAGAWVNSLFRKEGEGRASDMILAAIAATRCFWQVPPLGLVTFVDPDHVPGVMVRGERICGYSYLKAGFEHVGFTQGGLWAWQLLPERMPAAQAPIGMQANLWERADARDVRHEVLVAFVDDCLERCEAPKPSERRGDAFCHRG